MPLGLSFSLTPYAHPKTGLLCVALAVLELAPYTRLALNFIDLPPCLCLLSTGVPPGFIYLFIYNSYFLRLGLGKLPRPVWNSESSCFRFPSSWDDKLVPRLSFQVFSRRQNKTNAHPMEPGPVNAKTADCLITRQGLSQSESLS